jgi:hypothetical protein
MAKSKTVEVETAVIDNAGRNKIAAAVVDSIKGIGDSGSFLAHVCAVAQSVAKGKPIGQKGIADIMSLVEKSNTLKTLAPATRDNVMRNWSLVLETYTAIPIMREIIKENAGVCTHHHLMTAARAVRKGEKPEVAAKSVAQYIRGKRSNDAAKVDYAANAARALKAWLKHARGEKKAAILAAAESLGLKIV